MPRNGDGSGDSGPHDDHEIIHGSSGDKTLQHTKHVAPLPEQEGGEALPGLNASGGGAAPLNDASEEDGASAPRHEQLGEDEPVASNNGTSGSNDTNKSASSSLNNKPSISSTKQQDETKSSSGEKSSSGHDAHDSHDLESSMRKNAERFVNINEQDVQHASSTDDSSDDAGPKEDMKTLHGKGSAGKTDDKKRSASPLSEQQGAEKSRKQDGDVVGSGDGETGKHGVEGHEHEADPMRHNAAKFVNIEE